MTSAAMTAIRDQIEFDPAEHRYYLSGRRLPSVTEVLQDVGIVDYSKLPEHVRESTMDRGRKIHTATQYDDEHFFGFHPEPLDELSVAPEHASYLEAWRRFRAEKRFRAELIEHRGFNPRWCYAGMLDRSGYFEDRPLFRVILDLKTGTALPWVKWQLAAYAAFFDAPRSYLRVSVELHDDGTYQARSFHAKDFDRDFNVFCNALAVFRAKRECSW